MDNYLLWIGTLVMLLGFFIFVGMGLASPAKNKLFFYITCIIPLIAFTAYLAMAMGQGIININGLNIYYARYLDWLFTTPLLLIDLAYLAIPATRKGRYRLTATLVLADIYMITTGIFASITPDNTRYVWFILSILAFVVVLYILLKEVFVDVTKNNKNVHELYSILSTSTIVVWMVYPLVWLLGPLGVNAIDTTTEIACYLVLDIVAKVGFGYLLLSNHKAMDKVID